jgi:hypothetical protein
MVSDLVFNGDGGEICHVILAGDEKLTPIHWDSFTWSQPQTLLSLDMTAEEIVELPGFDPANVQNLCADRAATLAVGRTEAAIRSADGSAIRTAGVGEGAVARVHTCTQLSKVADYSLFAGDAELGSGGRILVEPVTGTVAFLSLTTYLIPWPAMKLSKIEDMDAYRLELAKFKAQLELAPKLSDEGADLNKKEFRLRLYKFYEVKPPAFDRETLDGGGNRR